MAWSGSETPEEYAGVAVFQVGWFKTTPVQLPDIMFANSIYEALKAAYEMGERNGKAYMEAKHSLPSGEKRRVHT